MSQEIKVRGLMKPLYFDDDATDEQIDEAITKEILPQLDSLQHQEQQDNIKQAQRDSFATGSKLEQFLAGSGRGLLDIYEGVGQVGLELGEAAGFVDPQTLSDYNKTVQDERDVWDTASNESTSASVGRFAGQFVPSLLVPGGPAGKGLLGVARQGAIQGAAQGALQFTDEDDSRFGNAMMGGGLGAAGGAAAHTAIGAITKGYNSIKGKMGPAEANIEELAKQFGLNLSAGDVSGNPGMKRAEQGLEYLPGLGMTKFREGQANDVKGVLQKVVQKYKGRIPETDYKWLDKIKDDATKTVVDKSIEKSHPIVAYHGTSETFDNFSKAKAGRDGFFFATNPKIAENVAEYSAEQKAAGGPAGQQIRKVRLSNPDMSVDMSKVNLDYDEQLSLMEDIIAENPSKKHILFKNLKNIDEEVMSGSKPVGDEHYVREESAIEPFYQHKTSEVIGSAKANRLLADINDAGTDPDDIIAVSAKIKEYRAHQIAGQLYDNVEKLAGKAKVPTTNLKTAISSIGQADRDALLSEPDVAKMVKELRGKIAPPDKVIPGKAKEFDYSQLRKARSDLKEKAGNLERNGKFKEASALREVVSGLEADIKAFTKDAPGLTTAQTKADQFYREKYGPIRDYSRKFYKNKESDVLTAKGLNPKSAKASQKFYSSLDDRGRAAVRYNVVQDAWDKAFDEATQRISPSKFAAHLEKNQKATQFFFKGADKQEIEGLTTLLRHMDRAGDYANKPSGASRIGQLGVLGGVAGGAILNFPMLIKTYGAAYILKQMMTTPAGKRIILAASTLGPKSTKALDMLAEKIPTILTTSTIAPTSEYSDGGPDDNFNGGYSE